MLDFGPPGPVGPVATVARTAVVAGTATAVAGGVARRQQRKYARDDAAAAAEAQQAAPPVATEASADAEPDYIVELRQLAELKASGVITAAEFDAKKKQILGV